MSEIEKRLLADFDTYYGRWEDYDEEDWLSVDPNLLGRYRSSRPETDIIVDSSEEAMRFFNADDPNTTEDENKLYTSTKNLADFKIWETSIIPTDPETGEPIIAVSSVSLDKSAISLIKGESDLITAVILPEDATNKTLTWTSSNKSIADIVPDGSTCEVFANNAGSAVITARSNNRKSASCKVSVAKPVVQVTGISLDSEELEMNINSTHTLRATVIPSDATNKTVTWTSSEPSIVKVVNGKLTALAEGSAVITATCGGYSAICEISVVIPIIEVSSITLSKSSLSITEGDSVTITASVHPSNATDKSIIWSSNDTDIAEVSESGVISAKVPGNCVITATANNGKFASCNLTVNERIIAVSSISLSESNISLTEGDEHELIATILPENATNKTITWASSKNSVATVTNGTITAVTSGSATITAITNNGKTASCVVNVSALHIPVSDITLNASSENVAVGSTFTLNATVSPNNASNKSIIWSSSNTNIATVVNGVVTAKGEGDVRITATSIDNSSVTAHCDFTMYVPVVEVSSVLLNKTSTHLIEGQSETLVATVLPNNATNKSLDWTSSNEDAVSVNNGVITALAEGNSVITASSNNGKSAACSVSVERLPIEVSSISLSDSELSFDRGEQRILTATILPTNADNKTITWTVSNSNCAITPNSNQCVITGNVVGSCVITAISNNGKVATCNISINEPIVNPTSIYLGYIIDDETMADQDPLFDTITDASIGAKYILMAAIEPDDVTNDSVTWEVISGDEHIELYDVAESSCKGLEALAAGTSVIKVTTHNGISDELSITVLPEPEIPEDPSTGEDDGMLRFSSESWVPVANASVPAPTASWDSSTNTLTTTFSQKSQKLVNSDVIECKYYLTFDSVEYLNNSGEAVDISGVEARKYIGFYEGGTSIGGTGLYSIKPYTVYTAIETVQPYNNEKVLQFNSSSKYTAANGAVLPITIVIHNLKYNVYTGTAALGADVSEEVAPVTTDPSAGEDPSVDPNMILGSYNFETSEIEMNENLPIGNYTLAYCDADGNKLEEWQDINFISKD